MLIRKNLSPLPIMDINIKLNKFTLKIPDVIDIILKGKGVKAPKKIIKDP